MANLQMFTQPYPLLAAATQTTTGNSAALTLPEADSYRLLLVAQTVSGTTPTLDVAILTSLDGGTNYVSVLQFDQMTTTGAKQIVFRPYLGETEVATHQTVGLLGALGTVDLATNSALAANGPIDPRYIKVRWQLSGTSPSFNFQINALAAPSGE